MSIVQGGRQPAQRVAQLVEFLRGKPRSLREPLLPLMIRPQRRIVLLTELVQHARRAPVPLAGGLLKCLGDFVQHEAP